MRIRLAHNCDDAQLRTLMHKTVMPGHIRMIYSREPDYFHGAKIAWDTSQVIVADNDGEIAGVGCRSISTLYVNGRPQPVGYLSGLRVEERFQNGTVLAKAYSQLKRLHRDKQTKAYLTTIIHGNDKATRLLTSKRAGLPSYIPFGAYLTHVIPIKAGCRKNFSVPSVDIIPSSEIHANELLKFLNEEGPRRQFFPVCQENENGLVESIGRKNILVARKDGQIVGVLAIWNQSKFKQHIVAGYSRTFQMLHPLLNLGLKIKGCGSLPLKGETLRSAVVSLVCIKNDDPRVFSLLLQHAMKVAAKGGLHQFLLGMHERDPLCSCVKKLFHVIYRSCLYLVCWEDGLSFVESLDEGKVPYMELGTL